MNKKALITGSSAGIGLAIAQCLAENGFDVFLTGRNIERLKKNAEKLNAKGFCACDLAKDNAPEKLYNNAMQSMGGVDILINNAGAYLYSEVENTPSEQIVELMKLNFEAPYRLIKLATPAMKKQHWGRIINIASISGVVGEANASLYSASKSALVGMSKALTLELAEFCITANTISPGWVDTGMSEGYEAEKECIPQKRFVHPDEVANLARYLCSDIAKGITGQNINLCAGLSLG